MSLIPARWTIGDYHRIIAIGILDDRRVELLNGLIVEGFSESPAHAHLSTISAEYLQELLGDRVELREGHPITLFDSNSEPEPDIAIVQPLRREYLHHHPYPENIYWLIEFADTTGGSESLARDLNIKARIYAAAGIAEYWVVNLQAVELVVMRDPVEGVYQQKMTWKEGVIEPLGFAGVVVEVDRLLG